MSLAGPTANLLFAIVLGVILRVSPVTNSGIWPGISFLLVLQISAVLFNLIPLPPFDGYNAIEPFLSPGIRTQMDRFRDFAIWIILLAFWFVPFIGGLFWGGVLSLSTMLGADWDIALTGLQQFRFWEL